MLACMHARADILSLAHHLLSLAPAAAQVVYFRVPVVGGSWPAGQERTFYFNNVWARTAASRIMCLPTRAPNAGIVCAGVRRDPALSRFRVALRLRNDAGRAITAAEQASVTLGVQVGP